MKFLKKTPFLILLFPITILFQSCEEETYTSQDTQTLQDTKDSVKNERSSNSQRYGFNNPNPAWGTLKYLKIHYSPTHSLSQKELFITLLTENTVAYNFIEINYTTDILQYFEIDQAYVNNIAFRPAGGTILNIFGINYSLYPTVWTVTYPFNYSRTQIYTIQNNVNSTFPIDYISFNNTTNTDTWFFRGCCIQDGTIDTATAIPPHNILQD